MYNKTCDIKLYLVFLLIYNDLVLFTIVKFEVLTWRIAFKGDVATQKELTQTKHNTSVSLLYYYIHIWHIKWLKTFIFRNSHIFWNNQKKESITSVLIWILNFVWFLFKTKIFEKKNFKFHICLEFAFNLTYFSSNLLLI